VRCKIVVMEATVAVDETDSAIQKVMRTESADVHYGRLWLNMDSSHLNERWSCGRVTRKLPKRVDFRDLCLAARAK
jgi:hypothetical protein